MHRKLMLGALAVCLTGGLAQAQTTTDPAAPAAPVELVIPEGFTLQTMPLTAEDLLGATIYDIGGDSIGEVHDLVFAAPEPAATGTTPGAPDATAPDSTAAPDVVPAPDQSGTMPDSATDPAAAPDAPAAPDSGDAAADGTTDGTAPATGGDAMPPSGEQAGQITHAVLDIGGFLGMGQHRIALPVSDLRIYRSDSDLRVYLPWTREQMTALPEYDENDPATLGRPLMMP